MNYRSQSSETTESRTAELMDGVFGECWTLLDAGSNGGSAHEIMASRAVGLYQETGALMLRRSTNEEEAGPIDYALALLREIADGYAMLSNDWDDGEREILPLPQKILVEEVIRGAGVDRWMSALGYSLPLTETRGGYQEWVATHEAESVEGSQLAAAFVAATKGYEAIVAWSYVPNERQVLSPAELREAACRDIANARNWAYSARRTPEEGAHTVTAAMLLMAEALYVASCSMPFPSIIFPDTTYLRELIGETEGGSWLASQGVALPPWL